MATPITEYQLKKHGFISYTKTSNPNSIYTEKKNRKPVIRTKNWVVPMEKNDGNLNHTRGLMYEADTKILYLVNVYANRLRIVNTMEQIHAIFESITSKKTGHYTKRV